MRKFYLILLFTLCAISACKKEPAIEVKSQEELDKKLEHKYIKVFYNSENLELKDCKELNFSFEDAHVLKLSQSEFEAIKNGLKDLKLDPMQVTADADISLEFDGMKYCLNHLGQLYRNNRKLIDNAELVYMIKSKTNYYNYFDEENLIRRDSIIAKNGVPFSYKRIKPNQNGILLENDSLVVETKNELIKHNLILTY